MGKITLTSAQSKFFNVVMKAASEDKELARFLRTPASGKSFVMEQIYTVLNCEHSIKAIYTESDDKRTVKFDGLEINNL